MDCESSIDSVVAKMAIENCLYRNALGCDILDLDMWKSTYWADASEDHGWYKGNAHAFVEATVPELRRSMDMTWHKISNVLIELDGDDAKSNAYFFAYCRLPSEDGRPSDLTAGGRYVDRFQRRAGIWKIKSRITKSDWTRTDMSTYVWGTEILHGYTPNLGMRDGDDPSRVLLGRQSG